MGGPAVNAVIPAWLGLPSTVTAIVVAAVTAALLFSSRWCGITRVCALVRSGVCAVIAPDRFSTATAEAEATGMAMVAFVLSLAIGAEALLFSSLNLDFGNIILMWIILPSLPAP